MRQLSRVGAHKQQHWLDNVKSTALRFVCAFSAHHAHCCTLVVPGRTTNDVTAYRMVCIFNTCAVAHAGLARETAFLNDICFAGGCGFFTHKAFAVLLPPAVW